MAAAKNKKPARRARSRSAKRSAPALQTIAVSSWHEFVELAASPQYEGWAFRGQERAEWPMFSSLSRHLRSFVPSRSRWPNQEARSMRIFRRKAHHFGIHDDELDGDLSCLALMQHYGAPTRLLDFTKSPYVAAFFALEKATGDAAVWAVNTHALYFDQRLRLPDGKRFSREATDPRRRGVFERFYLGGDRVFAWAGEPWRMNRRLIAQSGTFVVPGVVDIPLEEILGRFHGGVPMLTKFVLPGGKVRSQGMDALYRMNVTNATLFPELDGLARSLAFELEIEWRGARAEKT